MHDLVAARFELTQQFGQRHRRIVLEIVHQHNALAVFGELRHRRLDDVIRFAQLEIERVDIGREDGHVACAQISHQFGRLLQIGKAEERRGRSSDCHVHRARAHFDLLLSEFDVFRVGVLGQVLMRPGVIADRHSGRGDVPGYIGPPGGVFADLEEGRFDAIVFERLQNHRRVFGPRAVVEGQHDFFVAQEIVLLEVLGPECRTAGGVDFDDTRKTDGVGIIASGNGFGGRRGRYGRGRGRRRCCRCRGVLSKHGWCGRARRRRVRRGRVRRGGRDHRLRNLSHRRGLPSRLRRNGLARCRCSVALPRRDHVGGKCDQRVGPGRALRRDDAKRCKPQCH